MKIALIGNSHLAAVKAATRLTPLPADMELTFFGASGWRSRELELRGRSLFPLHKGTADTYRLTAGRDRIDLDAYDLFATVGLIFSYREFLYLFRRHVRYCHAALRPRAQIVSDAALDSIIEQDVAKVHALFAAIRKATGKRIVAVASPCPGEESIAEGEFKGCFNGLDDPYAALLYDDYTQRVARYAAQNGYELVPPRRDIQDHPGFNPSRYSTGSRDAGWVDGTRGPEGRGDIWHMNAAYGALVLEDILTAAAGLLPELHR